MFEFPCFRHLKTTTLLVVLVLSFGTAFGQDPGQQDAEQEDRDEEAVLFEVTAVSDVDKEIQAAAKLPGANDLTKQASEPLQVWVNRVHLGVDNAYVETRIRYLAVRVTLLNQSDEVVTINTGEISLAGWGETYSLDDHPKGFDRTPVRIGREVQSMSELLTPQQISISERKAASFWCVFAGLPNTNSVEDLVLRVPLEQGGQLQHDLRVEQHARLGMVVEKIGPKNALGLITLHGAFNSVNAQDLADKIRELSKNNVKRVVIGWAVGAKDVEPDLIDWLLHRATQEMNNELYSLFPLFPELEFLALGSLPEINLEDEFEDEFGDSLFDSDEEAVRSALKELFDVIDSKYVSREIRQGHPFSQRAALASLASRRDRTSLEGMFTLLTQLYDSADEQTRRYVLLAIGQQSEPQAIPMLVNILERKQNSDAEGALVALIRSNQPHAVTAVEESISERSANVPRERQIELLTENYRRRWSPYLLESLHDESPLVRSAALSGLVKVGHPRLSSILKDALKDDTEEVRQVAFGALVDRTDAESERAAIDHALHLLKEGTLNENVSVMITRTRDQRAAPLILAQIQTNSDARAQLLELLEEVGDERSVRQLLKQEEMLTTSERVLLYQLVSAFDLPEKLEIAQKALRSKELEIRQIGIAILTQQVSDKAAEAIYDLLPSEDENEVKLACYALGQIGTPQAEEFLKQIRQDAYEQKDEKTLSAAREGLRLWMSHSPGWNAIESAYYHSQIENYENALNYFSLAIEIDPELGVAHSGKGNTLLKMKKIDEAGAAFQRAYEIDDFDGQAITGVGIVRAMQGEIEAAVKLTVESASKFPNDNIFSYNTACVYGRAIESLKKRSDQESVKQTIQEYEAKAIHALKKSIEYGFDEFALMRTDPDIHALRSLPEFQELLEN